MEVEDESSTANARPPAWSAARTAQTPWISGHNQWNNDSYRSNLDWNNPPPPPPRTATAAAVISQVQPPATTAAAPIEDMTVDRKSVVSTRVKGKSAVRPQKLKPLHDTNEEQIHLARRDAAFLIEQYRDPKKDLAMSLTGDPPECDDCCGGDHDDKDAKDVKTQHKKGEGNPNAEVLKALDPEKEGRPNAATEPLELWFVTEIPADEIVKRRKHIKDRILSEGGDGQGGFVLSVASLKKLVCEYDRLFFNNRLFEALNHQRAALDVQVGGIKMQKGWAGCCTYRGDVCSIHMHPGLGELKFGADVENACEDVNGIHCHDILDCVQLVLEHEMIHMLIFVFLKLKEVHGRNFKALGLGLFGHTLYTHSIGVRGTDKHGDQSTEERVYRAQDADHKRKLYKPGTVVTVKEINDDDETESADQIAPGDANADVVLAAVLMRKAESLTIMHSNGRIVEKVPYTLTSVYEGAKDGAMDAEVKELESNYIRFLDNKKQMTAGTWIKYAGPDGQLLQAQVVAKKALGAVIRTNPSTTTTLPFHTIILSD